MVALLGVGLAVVAAIGLTVQAVVLRLATREGRTADALVVGYVINLVVILPAALVVYYPDYGLTPLSVAAFVGAGIAGSLLGRGCHYAAISRVGASRAEAVKASQSLHAAIIAVVLLDEPLSAAHLGAIVLIILGLFLLATEQVDDPISGRQLTLRSFAYPVAGAIFFGLQPAIAKLGLAEGTPVVVGLSISLAAAGFGYVGFLRVQNDLPTAASVGPHLRGFAIAGVGATVFMLAFYSSLAVAPVAVVVPIVQSSPILIVLTSAVLLRKQERITPRLLAAIGVVVTGAVGVTLLG